MPRIALDHPFPIPPQLGVPVPVAPGVMWLRMPLPFALDHINLWLVRDGEGWAAIDTGMGDEATRALWLTVLDGHRLTRLIATHFHPDHMGLAGWLVEHCGITLASTLTEWLFGRMLTLDAGPDYLANQVEHYRRAGYDEDLLAGIRQRGNAYRGQVSPLPAAIDDLTEGRVLDLGGRGWRIIIGRGHASEHACLYCAEAGILIAGDQVLPRISPIVGVWPQQPEENPLAGFLASLQRLKELPADTLVLPSHGLPFRGLHDRLDELARHHANRLDRMLEVCAEPATALEIARKSFHRPLDPRNAGFAVGETLAHLNYLREGRAVVREVGADGVWRYRRVQE